MPILIDHNPLAHFLHPIDMIFQGWLWMPLISASGPRALKRITQLRTICRVTLPRRAASERELPS